MRGFSLGEVLLSIVVLTVGLLPILKAMSGSLQVSFGSRDIVIASELAQEGAELVKNVKDNYMLAGNRNLDALFSGKTRCRIDYATSALDCASASYDLSGAPLRHAGATGRFKRKILIGYDSTKQTADCISVVYWGTYVPTSMSDVTAAKCNSSDSCTYAETVLTPWQ